MKTRQPVRVGDVMRSAAAGWLGGGLEAAEVMAAWEAAAGGLRAICRVEGFRAGEMLVVARTSAAAQEVSLRREMIRRKINRRLGRDVVRAVRVTCCAEGWSGEGHAWRREEEASEPVLGAAEVERIERQIAAIQDGVAREGARRVMLRIARVQAVRAAMGWEPCSACGTLTDPRDGPHCPFCRPNEGG
jgi:hypothetical protein